MSGKRQKRNKAATELDTHRIGGRKTTGLRTLAIGCIAIGLGVSAYLLFRSFQLLQGNSSETIDVCQRVLGSSCDNALRSHRWWFLGISLAGWALVYYATFCVLFTLRGIVPDQFDSQALAAAVLLSLAGAAFSLCLACMMVAGLAPFCPLCLVLQAINLLLVPVSLRLSWRASLPFPAAIRAGVDFCQWSAGTEPSTAWWQAVGFALCASVALIVYQWVLIQTERRVAATVGQIDLEVAWKEFSESPRQAIPLDALDPRLGPRNAPIQLVVFSDFGCSGCRKFSTYLQLLINQFPDDLVIIFKHFPTADNRSASIAAQAAHRQGKFWEFHDALLGQDMPLSDALLRRIAGDVHLSPERFSSDLLDAAVRRKVETDTALADRLGIDATPAVFLNERRIQQISSPVLTGLIEQLREIELP